MIYKYIFVSRLLQFMDLNHFYYFLLSSGLQLVILGLATYYYLCRKVITGEVIGVKTTVKPFKETLISYSVKTENSEIIELSRNDLRFTIGDDLYLIKKNRSQNLKYNSFVWQSIYSRYVTMLVAISILFSLGCILFHSFNIVIIYDNPFYLKYPFLFFAFTLLSIAFYKYNSINHLLDNCTECEGEILKQINISKSESPDRYMSEIHFTTSENEKIMVYLEDYERNDDDLNDVINYHVTFPEIAAFKIEPKYGHTYFFLIAAVVFVLVYLFAPIGS